MNWKRFFVFFALILGLLALQSSSVTGSVFSGVEFFIFFCMLISVGAFLCIDKDFLVRMRKADPNNKFRIGYLIPFGICFFSIPVVAFPTEVFNNFSWLNLLLVFVGGIVGLVALCSIFSLYLGISLKYKDIDIKDTKQIN